MKYLGHDLNASGATRPVQKARVKQMQGRRHRLDALRRAAGRARAARIWSTGVLPSVGHGAAVNGINDTELRQMRSLAGSLCGYGGSGCLTLYLAVQKQ